MSTFDYEGSEVAVIDEEDDGDDEYDSVVRSVNVQESKNGGGYERLHATIPSAIAEELDIEKGDALMMETRDDGKFVVDPR